MSITTDARQQQPQPQEPSRWSELCETLIAAFPTLTGREVIETVASARAATDFFGLDPAAQFTMTLTIARNNLELLAGGDDLARLDPETHTRRKHHH